ncbi:MAG: hypothetical protein QNJ65_16810 [Xenococcaceae cyanobacterium MO_234.B1]|nr:hypothetical protein [Xenococcaceae cyanobacterium MO_234.B1]
MSAFSWLPSQDKNCIQTHTFYQLQTEVRNENYIIPSLELVIVRVGEKPEQLID